MDLVGNDQRTPASSLGAAISDRTLKHWALASLIANMVIIWTGSLVRLTKSGLGCDTWPQCSPESYVWRPEDGMHGAIEFGNRMLTFVLVAIAIGMFLAARRAVAEGRQPKLLQNLAFGVGLGIIAQAVIGGISVLMQLNPWVVGLHMVASVLLILMCVEMVRLTWGGPVASPSARLAKLATGVFALGIFVVLAGVVSTGAGPNSGDGAATRNGFDLEITAKIHAWSVWLIVALTILGLVWAWSDAHLRPLWLALLAAELVQGLIGYVQYFTHLPIALVFFHMVGTTLFTAALGFLWLSPRKVGASA